MSMSDNVSDKYTVSDKMSNKVSNNVSDKILMCDNVSDNALKQLILSYIKTHSEINTTTAAGLIDRSPGTARRMLSRFVDEGLIISVGANRNRRYILPK